MKTSKDRIITTHTGSLPRPQPLVDLVLAREQGRAIDAATFEAEQPRRSTRSWPNRLRPASTSSAMGR